MVEKNRRLDTKLRAELVARNAERVAQELKAIWGKHVNRFIAERAEYLDDKKVTYVQVGAEKIAQGENPTYGGFEVYQAIGRELVAYNGINDGIERVSELEGKMARLGHDVIFLAREFKDQGVIREERSWFGRLEHSTKADGHVFVPGSAFKELAPKTMADLTRIEKMRMYAIYLEQQRFILTDGFKYGKSFDELRQ